MDQARVADVAVGELEVPPDAQQIQLSKAARIAHDADHDGVACEQLARQVAAYKAPHSGDEDDAAGPASLAAGGHPISTPHARR